jgi:uncharacterized protein YeaO (DUF488 family)
MAIRIKNAGQPASPEDGARVLVERQPPPGSRPATLGLRASLGALAPSDELRRWFEQRPHQWLIFRRRYLVELNEELALEAFTELHAIADAEPTLTLLTLAAEPERSHGAILRDLLEGRPKPPATTGAARAASRGRSRARRQP